MEKQTAVTWLVEQYQQTIGVSITKVMIDKINQAKEMERWQKQAEFEKGYAKGYTDASRKTKYPSGMPG
jgi:hypothetical protein